MPSLEKGGHQVSLMTVKGTSVLSSKSGFHYRRFAKGSEVGKVKKIDFRNQRVKSLMVSSGSQVCART
jgi:hypothetical protein